MKIKSIALFLVFGLAVSFFSSSAFADDESKSYSWNQKLGRGALNIVSSPIEIARSIQIESNDSTLLQGWTVGLLKGIGNGFVRLGTGLIDVVTFPFNFPDNRKAPLVDPEYVWDKPGVRYA